MGKGAQLLHLPCRAAKYLIPVFALCRKRGFSFTFYMPELWLDFRGHLLYKI